jgi:prolyl oligopeptidase
LIGSPDAQLLAYHVTHSAESMTFDLYVHDLLHGRPAYKLLEQVAAVFQPHFVGQTLVALTNWKASNFRIVGINLDQPNWDQWFDILPESEEPIRSFAVVGGLLCVDRVENASSHLELFDLQGRQLGTVPVPPQGRLRLFRRPAPSDTVFYEYSSLGHSPTVFSYSPADREQKIWASTPADVPSNIEVKQVHYKSKDGTSIPLFLAVRKGEELSTPIPTFLTGYGGFGNCFSPKFNAFSTFLIEQGFLFAVANVRGGGEFGGAWHNAGKRHNRQNVIDDFVTAAEFLIEQGYTKPERMAIGGGSAGGLLVAAALTQAPELFRAVICLGPLLDMLRYHIFDFAHLFIDEYGSSDNPDDCRHLLTSSPYHSVRDGTFYPSVLFVSGDADTCANPMHVRKMAARLQKASCSGHPILIDYRTEWGHTAAQPLSRRIDALTDRLSFICNELGVPLRREISLDETPYVQSSNRLSGV